jgi:type I restriction enzyme, S subunit
MSKYDSQFFRLSDVGTVARGKSKHRPRNDPSLYGGKYPFIQTGDVNRSNFYITDYSQTYNEQGLAQSKLWNPGTLCITIAANIADTAILKISACFPDSIIGSIPDRDKSDIRFIKYCLDTYKLQIQSISQGTTQDNLSVEKLLSIKLKIPSLLIQKKIAAVLSAYDDLIENNDRRITLLEKMAEEIYREWFVRLRFPGHEQATFHKGIPEGWTWETLENLGFLGRGKSKHRPRNDLSLYEGDYPFIQTGEVKEASSSFYITNHTQTYNKKGLAQSKLWNPGTLLIPIAANIAETAILTYSACIPDSIIGFVPNPKKVSAEYIKYSVEYLKARIQNISQGTTQDNLSQSKLETFNFLVPSQITMNQFIEFSQPLFSQVKNLLLKNQHLKQTRDRLLTRLISDKLSVEDLDIQIPPSMTEAAVDTERQ